MTKRKGWVNCCLSDVKIKGYRLFYGNDFSMNKDYYKVLINRQELLSKELSPKVIIHNTLITTYGLKYNEYSSFFDNVITIDDLFVY